MDMAEGLRGLDTSPGFTIGFGIIPNFSSHGENHPVFLYQKLPSHV